jgi:hypothetical protein
MGGCMAWQRAVAMANASAAVPRASLSRARRVHAGAAARRRARGVALLSAFACWHHVPPAPTLPCLAVSVDWDHFAAASLLLLYGVVG